MPAYRFRGIVGTAWQVSAVAADKGREAQLISPNEHEKERSAQLELPRLLWELACLILIPPHALLHVRTPAKHSIDRR